MQRSFLTFIPTAFVVCAVAVSSHAGPARAASGRHLYERETFGGNGRTCTTCHSRETGTVSPADAQRRFAKNPGDPLFRGDGSDDGRGNGVTRMLADATILVRIPLPSNVTLLRDPSARSVVLRRGIPTTRNTPALDPVLMWDGREPDLASQARGAIVDHAEARESPTGAELETIAVFQRTPLFFSSPSLRDFARTRRAPLLPAGRTESEERGRRFFEGSRYTYGSKAGLCAFCHSGPMLNETNEFIPVPPRARGGRFQTVFVPNFNRAGNPLIDFVFQNADGSRRVVSSPDPGRALITGDATSNQSLNAFKIPTLWGVAQTAPYFHDNSAKTLEQVAQHYAKFFETVTGPKFDGNPPVIITEQEQADIVAFLKLLR